MDFQGHLVNTYNMLKKQPLIFILGGFLAHFLSIITIGLAAGPLIGGYLLAMLLYLRKNQQPQFNDLFIGFERFTALFPFFFLTLIIIGGFLLLIIPGVVFATWWIYTLPLMVDKELPLLPAMKESRAKVQEKGFFLHLVFLFMIGVVPVFLLNILTSVIPILSILQILLPSIQTGCLASLYIEQFENLQPENIDKPEELPDPDSAERAQPDI